MLKVQDLHKSYAGKAALVGISFEVVKGENVALLGPSGSGKSTLLKLIAGIEKVDGGAISWDGEDLAEVAVHERGFGLMFQDYALFPHRDVAGNVSFGLEMAEIEEEARKARVEELLQLVGMQSFKAREVGGLSGGEQQRVALARALAPKPRLLMLDEPLGSLDRGLRERLLADLKEILRVSGQTSLYVTHDQEEAFAIADRIVLLSDGQIAQMGSPQALYESPASAFVARFLGLDNLLDAEIVEDNGKRVAHTQIGDVEISGDVAMGAATILLRPDRAVLGDAGPMKLSGEVLETRFRGHITEVVVEINKQNLRFDFPTDEGLPTSGDQVALSFDEHTIQVMQNDE